MKPVNPAYSLSAIDEERFGVRTVRAASVTEHTLPSLLEFCRSNEVAFCIARCAVTELRAAQAMEREGFLLMDTLLYYVRDLAKLPVPQAAKGDTEIRLLRPGEEEAVGRIAADSFKGYLSHYHADSRLDPVKCDETYVSWAVRSCTCPGVADVVFIAERAGTIVGFFTIRRNSADEGEGVVGGIIGSARAHGIYRSFIIRGMEWCQSQGCARMIVSTQITNIAVQKVWTRLGFEPLKSFYTFHKWFDEAQPVGAADVD